MVMELVAQLTLSNLLVRAQFLYLATFYSLGPDKSLL